MDVRFACAIACGAAIALSGCAAPRCPEAAPPGARSAAGTAAAAPTDASEVAGTWLWSCCDGAETWIGVLVLTRDGTKLHGGFVSDGDMHGSYVEGTVEGERVRFVRRWYANRVLQEQYFDLRHDVAGRRLVGTFTQPSHSSTPRTIRIERGFAITPRLHAPAGG